MDVDGVWVCEVCASTPQNPQRTCLCRWGGDAPGLCSGASRPKRSRREHTPAVRLAAPEGRKGEKIGFYIYLFLYILIVWSKVWIWVHKSTRQIFISHVRAHAGHFWNLSFCKLGCVLKLWVYFVWITGFSNKNIIDLKIGLPWQKRSTAMSVWSRVVMHV